MSEPPPSSPAQAQWFIGRDGQQFGPVTEAEFRKLIELGHLRPTDLIWREGWPEWRPAHVLLPDSGQMPRQAAPAADGGADHGRRSAAPVHAPRGEARSADAGGPSDRGQHRSSPTPSRNTKPVPERDAEAALTARKSRKGLKIAGALVFFGAALAAAGWMYQPQLSALIKGASKASSGNIAAPLSVQSTSPIAGFSADPDVTDRMLQSTALFKLLKRSHADWYAARVAESSGLIKSGGTDIQALSGVMQAVVKLRRQHAENASAAPLSHLQAIGQSFVANLALMKSIGPDTCFAFISNGEGAPGIVELYQNKDHTALLQRQLVAVFDAVDEGRKTPRVYPVPKQTDYDVLVTELEARGWTQADIQMFSDSRALATAPAEKVCMLVTQWFESQLALKDPEVRLRLLVDSLRPMIAG